MKRERIPIGCDIKLHVSLTNLGESLLSGTTFCLTFTSGEKNVIFDVDDPGNLPAGISFVDDETVSVALETPELDPGDLYMQALVLVPDEEFLGHIRHEICEQDLNITLYAL